MKIAEIKELLQGQPTEELLNELEQDERSGVKKLLEAYYRRQERLVEEQLRLLLMERYENAWYGRSRSCRYIAGVDEAGRGPLAGPLVIAAVILPRDVFIKGLNDSKQLSAAKREQLYDEILKKAKSVAVNIVSISNIDRLNIYAATQQGMREVLEALPLRPQVALIDAMPVEVENMQVESIIHGDALSVSIAAASIIAKVTRDRIMQRLDSVYPEYGFAANKGYGSSSHMQAIREHGATRWHRRSYEPVKSLGLPPVAAEENILYCPQQSAYEYPVGR